jgi:hypothetical protein
VVELSVLLFSSVHTGGADGIPAFPGALQPIGDRIRSHNIAIYHGNVNMKS